jgi:flagellar biosynthetic protein FlhB
LSLGRFEHQRRGDAAETVEARPDQGAEAALLDAKGLVELLKAMGKFLLGRGCDGRCCCTAWSGDSAAPRRSLEHPRRPWNRGCRMVGWSALLIASTLIVLAMIDVPFQLWQHRRDLKMTQQEVRDETEGDRGQAGGQESDPQGADGDGSSAA